MIMNQASKVFDQIQKTIPLLSVIFLVIVVLFIFKDSLYRDKSIGILYGLGMDGVR